MPFETPIPAARRIAVIGGGISGMAAAHLLAAENSVVLFEGDKRLGGHACTVMAGKRGDQPVDMGFIVFNKVNYPHLTALFDRLGVPLAPSDMSFGCSIQGGWLEYGLRDMGQLFAQRRNAVRPAYLRMLADILRFQREAVATLTHGMTLGGLIQALKLGDWFRDYFIAPFSGAIWSTPSRGILNFPAETLVRFFVNHGLMGVSGQHQWFTVQGGSVEYVCRLQADMVRQGVDIRLGAGVRGIRRMAGGVLIRAEGGEWEAFDEVVLATHSDDGLALLSDASPLERAALSAIRYQPNEAILHADPSQMPRRRRAWSSWNYAEPAGPRPDRIDLTYWMNSLQPIPQDDPLFVTLNPNRPIAPHLIHEVKTFRHPVYDQTALQAQARLKAVNGQNATWFCGAWMGHGFHEDGFASALAVVQAMARNRRIREAA